MTFHDPRLAAGGRAMLLTGPFGAPERTIDLDRPMAVAEIIAAHGLSFSQPTVAVLDGEPLLRGCWAVRVIRPGEVIAFVAVPRGGGESGGQGKQIVGLIAALALSIAAPWAGAALFGAGTFMASVASAALLVGGSMLLNALMPPPSQDSGAAADPVYSVTAASNQATPLEPLPVLYGRLRYPPRYASRPYSEYEGNDQYLYQLFHVTAGKADIEQIDIGETEAWSADDGYSSSFSDLQFQIIQPGEAITLFPANVVTSGEVSGQTVPDPAAVLGPFVVNAAGTTVDRLAVDFAFPGGLWTANGKAVDPNSIALRAQFQRIDNSGAPLSGWATVFAETISAATRTPQRMSRSKEVAPARYQVRFLADEAFDADDGDAVNRVVWTGLRGYLTDFVTPPNCTLLAVKVRANEQLTQFSSNQIRVTAERYLPVWDGTDWVEEKTRSIAWAAADLLMNSDYSIGLTSAQFDLAQLDALATTWSGRGDTFNAIFDRSWTIQEALRATLRAGRTQAVRMGGRIGFVRLEPKLIRRAVFSPRNLVRGSFSHKLVLFDEEKPDSVIGKFIDETIWQPREVKASLTSVGSDLPQTIDWFGITDHGQAWRESVTEAAVNAYNREFVSFTADWEGKLLVRGEPILVQHPFIEGVETVALAERAGDVLTIDRDPAAVISGDAYVILRGKTGQEWGPCLVDSIVDRTIILNAADRALVVASMGSLASILPTDRSERAHVLICDGETRPFNGLVVSAVPSSSGKVDVLAVIDAPEVYLADGTEVMPSPWFPPTLPPQNPARPLLLGLYGALRAAAARLELDAMWQPSPGAIGGYVAEVSYDNDGVAEADKTWTPIYSGMVNRFTATVLPQPLALRVAAVGVLQGPWSKRVFLLSEVPDISLTPVDFYPDLGDTLEVLNTSLKWLAASNKQAKDDLQSVVVRLQDQGDITSENFQQVRTSLTATRDLITADYELLVTTAVGVLDGRIVGITSRVETLEVSYADPVTGNNALASGLDAIVVQINDSETGLAAIGDLVSSVQVQVNDVSASGTFRVSALASPGGGWSNVGLYAEASDGSVPSVAALLLQAKTDGSSRAILVADNVSVSDAGGTVSAMFEAGTAFFAAARIQDASIGTAKIIDANITTAKIANAAITEAKIGTAAITTAKIGTAAITSAKIDDLQVTTIKVANNAITLAQSDTVADGAIPGTTGKTATIVFTGVATGAIIQLASSLLITDAGGGANYTLTLYRNGTQIDFDTAGNITGESEDVSLKVSKNDIVPSGGTITYTAKVRSPFTPSAFHVSNDFNLTGILFQK